MDYEIWPLGDSALLLRFGGGGDEVSNAWVHAAMAALRAEAIAGVRALAPSYAALVLTLDLAQVARSGGIATLTSLIDEVLRRPMADGPVPGAREIEVPTRYGGVDGPDLGAVASHAGLSEDAVIQLHVATTFRVAMLGFQPGFPYLLGLPPALQMPRRRSVRPRVPAGSVAIAGAQAGIYPNESPGGWHLIGRTEVRLFDPQAAEPALLLPGDRVRFVAAG